MPGFLESVGFLTLCGAGFFVSSWLIALGWGVFKMWGMYDDLDPVWQAKNYGVVYCDECNAMNRRCRNCGHPLFAPKDLGRAKASDRDEQERRATWPTPCTCRKCEGER